MCRGCCSLDFVNNDGMCVPCRDMYKLVEVAHLVPADIKMPYTEKSVEDIVATRRSNYVVKLISHKVDIRQMPDEESSDEDSSSDYNDPSPDPSPVIDLTENSGDEDEDDEPIAKRLRSSDKK